mmetsp:Transcript_21685/g.47410  ORF Transcript_21685/g.47410 Transcript_21685/m.47410 type:complete len:166 (-) Transcript_21685:395-892(-)
MRNKLLHFCPSSSDDALTHVHVPSCARYAEPFISGVRLICSSGKLSAQYWGEMPDDYFFGKNGTQRVKAECEEGGVITGFHWREALLHTNKKGEMRLAGITLLCTQGQHQVIDSKPQKHRAHNSTFECGKQPKLAAGKGSVINKVVMWWTSKSWAGMEPMVCASS